MTVYLSSFSIGLNSLGSKGAGQNQRDSRPIAHRAPPFIAQTQTHVHQKAKKSIKNQEILVVLD